MDEIFHTKPKKRYADTDARAIFSLCARCLRRCGHNFLIRHLKTTYRQNYRKAFSLVFSALEFSLNQFFANKPTELPYVWHISSSTRNLVKFIWIPKDAATYIAPAFQITAKFRHYIVKS